VSTNGNVVITAAAIPGRRYTLATKADLDTPGAWTAVGTTQTATGTSMSFSTPVVIAEAQRFYRVMLLP